MAAPTPTVTLHTNLTAAGGPYFTLDDPVKGVLDSVTYLLVDDVSSDITNFVKSVQITRGRNREQDEFNVGVATLTANNHLRTFDPEYAGSPYFGNIVPGKQVTIMAGGTIRFEGVVDDWNYDYSVDGDSTTTFDVVDRLAQLGNKSFDDWTTNPGETAGPRLAAILARPEVAFSSPNVLEPGTATLQGDNVSWGSNVLNYAQLVAKAEYGKLFATKEGTLTFYDSAHSYSAVGAPVLSDASVTTVGDLLLESAGYVLLENGDWLGLDGSIVFGAIPFSAVEIDYGTELLFNRVSVDAIGFTKQTTSDSGSIASYGVKSLSLSGLPLDSEAQALNLANTLLSLYSQPQTRFANVTVDLHRLTTVQQDLMLNLDIGSVVRITYTPNKLPPAIDKFCIIEGFTETWGPMFHQMKISVSDGVAGYDASLNLVLDSATAGLLDTNVLAF